MKQLTMPAPEAEAKKQKPDPVRKLTNRLSNKKLRILLTVLLIVFAVFLAAIYISIALKYQNVYYKGTMINQIDAGYMTPGEVEKLIADRASEYELKIAFREDQTETISAEDIEYHFVSDGSAAKLLNSQPMLLWPKGYLAPQTRDVSVNTTFNEDLLREKLLSLPEFQDENMKAPTDALVSYEKDSFKVVPETYGTTLDKETVINGIMEAVRSSSGEIVVDDIENSYTKPAIYKDDEGLKAEAAELNSITTASITWELPNGEQTLDGNTLREWLKKDENGHYYKDEDSWNQHIEDYVEELALSVKTLGGEHKFKGTGLDKEVTVKGGTYGWRMDYEDEVAQVKQELADNAIVKREPDWSSREFTTENNGFGDTYIEVDLSRQHVWVYKDGEMILDSDCVSGRMNKSRYTPSGVYTLMFKARNRTLRGQRNPETGKPSYESFVKYWMPFNGGIGFHDASWRSSFGGTRYIHGGSHGCVNLPTKFAPKLYEVITKEMPIVCYYSDGCSLED